MKNLEGLISHKLVESIAFVVEDEVQKAVREERSKIYAICYEVSRHVGDNKDKLQVIGAIQTAIKQLD